MQARALVTVLSFLLLLTLGCSSGGESSSDSALIGTWRVYGASSSPSGAISETGDMGAFVSFRSDGTFSQTKVWSCGSAGTWSGSGSSYTLRFSGGETRTVNMRNGELYSSINGMYWWMR